MNIALETHGVFFFGRVSETEDMSVSNPAYSSSFVNDGSFKSSLNSVHLNFIFTKWLFKR